MKFLSTFPFHTFLLAATTVLSSIVQVTHEVLPEEMVPPLLLMEVYALVVYLLALAFFRQNKKAGIAASFIVGLTLCFEQFRNVMAQGCEMLFHFNLPDFAAFLLFWTLVFAALKLIFARPKVSAELDEQARKELIEEKVNAQFDRMHVAFNVMCTIVLALNVVPLAFSEFEQAETQNKMVALFNQKFDTAKLSVQSKGRPAAATQPDVYYIILDAFASHDTLKEFGAYDNTEFIDFLKSKGFYVVDKARSNYDRTPFSISSSMNMQYIDQVPKTLGENYVADNVYYRLIQRSPVLNIFKSLGYKIINISSGSFATDHIPQADQNLHINFGNHFTTCMMMLTPLLGLEKYFPTMRDGYCQRRLAPKWLLPEAIKIAGPKFVLVHTDLPHPPSLFDEKGNMLALPRELLNDHSSDMKAYVAQLKYCQTEVKSWLNLLLAQPVKPIIIVQSDHGLYYERPNTKEYFNEVMRILNAYYLPPTAANLHSGSAPYSTITPVNSFRMILNRYFAAQLPLLPDQSFCSPVRTSPYKWSDVQSQLTFSSTAAGEDTQSKTSSTTSSTR